MKQFNKYWNDYYKKNESPNFPSNFAKYIKNNYLKKNFNILEIGAGNGRDSLYFAKFAKKVLCIDNSSNAIKIIKNKTQNLNIKNLNALQCNVDELNKILNSSNKFDLIYMRWFLQSINELYQDRLFKLLRKYKKKTNLIIAIEARTDNDNIKNKINSKFKNKNEYIFKNNHYRRLINRSKIVQSLEEKNFKIIYNKISTNFSKINVKHSNSDPQLLRLIIK